MDEVVQRCRTFWGDESGQDLIEYALVAILISLAAIGAMTTIGNEVTNGFNRLGSQL